MKVLILSHSSALAGAEKSMIDLFDYWGRSTDLEFEFIIRKPLRGLDKALKQRDFKYHILYYTNWAQRKLPRNSQDIYWYAKHNTRAVEKIEKIIKDTHPDIVMTNTSVAPWAAIAAQRQGVPHIWFVREFGSADHDFEYRLGERESFEAIDELSDLVVVNSEALARFVSKYIDKNKITVLYPNIDLESVFRMSKQNIISPFKNKRSLKLVSTGRIAPSKGQDLAAEAVGILNEQGINCELCIVGSPSEDNDASSLHEVIKKYNISDKVHIIGHQANPYAFVAEADIGITASTKEAFGRVTLEYMALGKPVIGSNSGGTAELIEVGKNGYLFQDHDAGELASMLLNYANHHQLIDEHGKNSKLRAEKLMRQNTPIKLYERLMEVGIKEQSRFKPNSGKWKQYPVLLNQKEKPEPRSLHKTLKNLLKSCYLLIR